MTRRVRYSRRKRTVATRNKLHFFFICGLAVIILLVVLVSEYLSPNLSSSPSTQQSSEAPVAQATGKTTARIMAHGDLLYHLPILRGAERADGTYDFSDNFTYVTPWIEQADLAIADFEGTISPDFDLAGYPLFNAPASVAEDIRDAGYDVVDLAHNHILDSQLSGLISTVETFKNVGIDAVGVYATGNRVSAPIYIKEVNGIKIAILAYAYGFNGMESLLTQEEYDAYLSDFNREKMQAEIERAEQEADITIVMPQTGVEYQLQPTEEQTTLYRQMIDWGADIIFGGHPHVVEPAEVVEKDGKEKLIIYSMGNFLSNQRLETMADTENYQWTERGVLMDLMIEKDGDQTIIKTAQARPTWVNRISQGTYSADGYELFTYQTYILEDFIAGGKHYGSLDADTQARIEQAYQETKKFMHIPGFGND